MQRYYPIGTPGEPWTDTDKVAWFEGCTVQRSYKEEVIQSSIVSIAPFQVEPYGALSIDPQRYPLLAVTCRTPVNDRPWVLVTGGVHGYETSGVQGALAFLATVAPSYADRLNLLVVPCVSPWGYEVINRWNPSAIDPNRSFVRDSPAEESAALMKLVDALTGDSAEFLVHVDLHETTGSDEQEFRPALAARGQEAFEPGHIPDGFYTVGDTENPQPGFQADIVEGVRQVTHIAPADANGQIIGADVTQTGVINYPFRALGLCGSVTQARFTTTTEVYPDSAEATPEICNQAQIAAVRAALDYALRDLSSSGTPAAGGTGDHSGT